MSEQLREALSAAVDGEASEFELRRVCDEMAKDESLARAWQSYHLIKQAAQGENVQNVERMGERIWASLDAEQFLEHDIIQEEPLEESVQPVATGRFRLIGGALAVALALAVVLSSSFLDSDTAAPGATTLQDDGLVDRGAASQSLRPAQIAAASVVQTEPDAALQKVGFSHSSNHDVPGYDYGPGFVPYSELSPADQARSDGYFLHHVQHQAVNNDNVLSFVKMISYAQ